MNEPITHIEYLPAFVKLKKDFGYEAMLLYQISNYFMYTVTRKGWDMNCDGEEVYYINELGRWVPLRFLDVVNEFIPN